MSGSQIDSQPFSIKWQQLTSQYSSLGIISLILAKPVIPWVMYFEVSDTLNEGNSNNYCLQSVIVKKDYIAFGYVPCSLWRPWGLFWHFWRNELWVVWWTYHFLCGLLANHTQRGGASLFWRLSCSLFLSCFSFQNKRFIQSFTVCPWFIPRTSEQQFFLHHNKLH